jgi:hypothetical protein
VHLAFAQPILRPFLKLFGLRGINARIPSRELEDRRHEFCHFESIISVPILAGDFSGDFLLYG